MNKPLFTLLIFFTFPFFGQNLGKGINLGNMFEAPSETAWGNPYKEEYISQIAELGFNHIRVPIRWDVPERTQFTAPYTINPVFLLRIKSVIDLALNKNLYVIINMHHHEELFTDPTIAKPRFIQQWIQIANYFKGYDSRLIFEVLNEPHDKLTPELWNVYFSEALTEIRKTNPTRKVLIGTASYGGIAGLKDLILPNDPNLIVTIHYYNPFNFTHQGADWAGLKDKFIGTKWEDLSWERNQIISEFDYAIKWAKQKNIPLHVGEFGSYELADIESRAKWTTFLSRWLESQGISWAYWEFSAGFGIYTPSSKTYKMPLVNALLKNPLPPPKILPTKNIYELKSSSGWNLNLNSGANGNLLPLSTGLKINLLKTTGTAWHIQLTKVGFPLAYQKRYIVRVKASADKESSITAYMGKSTSPYNAYSAYNTLNLGPTEKEFSFIFTMNNALDPNARISFDLGTQIGSIEITSLNIDEVVEDLILENTFEPQKNLVYPNPFSDRIKIVSRGPKIIRLMDFQGKTLIYSNLKNDQEELETSQWKTGIYFLQIINTDTGYTETHKLLKENPGNN
jgi:endoglucanase